MPDAALQVPSQPTALNHRSRDGGLDAALRWFGEELGPGTALISTPRAFLVARVDQHGTLGGPAGDPPDVDSAFEARVFSPAGELRWRATPSGGEAVLLTLGQPGPEQQSTPVRATIDGGYLLWGTVEASGSGWSRLRSAQVGTIEVPLAAANGATIRLRTTEVVSRDDHGNAVVIDELLRDWEVIRHG